MNKIRLLIAAIAALLINYVLFAAFGQLITVGTRHYDNSLEHPAISINLVPLYEDAHKDEHKQTHSTPLHTPVPIQPPDDNIYNEQTHGTIPTNEKHEDQTLPKPKPLSIVKHIPADITKHTSRGLEPIFRVEPIYPMFAIIRGIEGWVRIEFAIAENGEVINPRVTASEPPEVFAQTALTAVSEWRYPPGNKSKSSVHIKFELRDH